MHHLGHPQYFSSWVVKWVQSHNLATELENKKALNPSIGTQPEAEIASYRPWPWLRASPSAGARSLSRLLLSVCPVPQGKWAPCSQADPGTILADATTSEFGPQFDLPKFFWGSQSFPAPFLRGNLTLHCIKLKCKNCILHVFFICNTWCL